MKRHSSLVIPAILALCAVLPLPAARAAETARAAENANTAAAKPKAVVAEPVKDFGKVAKGDKVAHDFVVRNEGNAPLEITQVRPGCGCTVAEYDKTVAPGKTGNVHTVLDTATFNGPVSKGVQVYTNDPENPQIQLTLKLDAQPYIDVKPGYARFITVQGEAKQGDIVETLWANDESPFKILKADTPVKGLTVTYREATEAERRPEGKGKQWRVEIKLANDAPVGPLADYVHVYTDHPKQKIVEIPVTGFVRPVIAVTPPVADFGQVELKEPLTKSVNLRNFASEAINLTSVDNGMKGVEAKLEPLEAGREYQVRLTLKPELGKGPFNGRLMVHTDSAKVPVIELNVKGTVL